ncbi:MULTISPECIES: hypothetical protein [Rhizobium]|uniref:hypothetical protein n=1 Tax=Rhizobium TaxID=379 RepID=UPI001249D954|nr:hypothetical protein [Rhizobium leguminosarum]
MYLAIQVMALPSRQSSTVTFAFGASCSIRNQRFGGGVERYVGGYTLDVHKKMKFIASGSL